MRFRAGPSRPRRWRALAFLSVLTLLAAPSPGLSQVGTPAGETALQEPDDFAALDVLLERAVAEDEVPGLVVLVWHRGAVVYERALGRRAVRPAAEPMTVDTIFDLASLTKVVATTPAVMRLVEDGRLRLRDRVADLLPGFARHGKDAIRVQDLLTHVSGLRPDFPLEEEFEGREAAWDRLVEERPVASPGERFIYSDLNFIALAEIVARVSRQPFEAFTRDRLFQPLAMTDTGFGVAADDRPRTAPTEACRPLGWPCGDAGSTMLRGVVHDPTARRMGGVAGHAGLFGTARDLARYAAMLLSGGRGPSGRLFSPLTIERMTRVSSPPRLSDRRALGWDVDSRFSANRGDLFGPGSYGHTGFTGTSLWLDPDSQTAVIFLSSRLHPDGRGNVTALRGRVATLAARAIADPIPPAGDAVRTGIDRLQADGFARLRGRVVGLVTNHTGRTSQGGSTIDALHQAPEVELRRLFSPEHGIRGGLDAAVPDEVDPLTGLTIHSLYGETRRPAPAWLSDLDVVVIDLQDAGARFYTYAATMAYVMEEAARQDVDVLVLDRPNPIGGVAVEGPLLDAEALGFNGYLSMPTRHGLTLGELARVFNAEADLGAALDVVPMAGWRRGSWYDETGLVWRRPSPNLRTVPQAGLYPGVGSIEGTNVSVGRGTDTPFEVVGAPWVDGPRLARALNARALPGLRFYPVEFTPRSSRHAGEPCEGVRITVVARHHVRPVRLGVELAAALHRHHPDDFALADAARLLGSREAIERIAEGDDPGEIAASWRDGERTWRRRVEPYLLYRD